jgi:hypothetical protein
MDYLVIEGHKTAAEHFSVEAGLPAPVDIDSIERRVHVREALYRGEVDNAITLVNDLDPEVCIVASPLPSISGLYSSCTTLRPSGVGEDNLTPNFSLQYDPSCC